VEIRKEKILGMILTRRRPQELIEQVALKVL